MPRRATAVWRGDLQNGKLALSTPSSILSRTALSLKTRFENGIGTNPEERLAAAHGGSLAMALYGRLGKAGVTPENLETTATITFEKVREHFAITKSHLDLQALVPGSNQEAFDAAVKAAETGCAVSELCKAEISVDARLEVTA